MSEKRYVVRLTADERARLDALVVSSQRVARKKRMRAQVLRKVDEGEHGPAWADQKAAEAFDVHVNTVQAIREDLVLRGFEEALERRKRAEPARKPIFDEKGEKEVLALAGVNRRKAARAGRCVSWPTKWSDWTSSKRSATKPYARS